jgi:dolichyl-phosphate-mannose-protein mannosyltransferase
MPMTRAWVMAGLLALLLLAPGYPTALFHGMPLGPAGTVLLTVVVFAAGFCHRWILPRRPAALLAGAVVTLIVVKVALVYLAPSPGWLSVQYPNGQFADPVKTSTEFSIPAATRIDRRISFADDHLPVFFLNETDFNQEMRREVTRALSIRWTAFVQPEVQETRRVAIHARGSAALAIDGVMTVQASSQTAIATSAADITFAPGQHILTLSYVKPANTDPFIELQGVGIDDVPAMMVTPAPAGGAARRGARWAQFGGVLVDAAVVVASVLFAVLVASAGPPLPKRRRTSSVRLIAPASLAVVMFALFIGQGAYLSSEYIGRAVTLTGGDDWLQYEGHAREIATHGLLMDYGQPRGQGEVFFYYPFYSYFLAGVHKAGGEDLFAPMFSHFVLLFATNIVVFVTTRRLFGERSALMAVAALVVIEELAFMRHYTVNLFSENLYFLTVAATICYLVRFVDTGSAWDAVAAGITGGLSAITRSAMMIYLPFAAIIVVVAGWRRQATGWRMVANLVLLLAAWFAVILPVTLRNYIVAGEPVLINNSPSRSFVMFNLPQTPDAVDRYLKPHTGTLGSATKILFQIMVEHPLDFARNLAKKAGFSLGLLELLGERFHPELLMASAGYLIALIVWPEARSPRTWPIHGFVAAHLLGMLLTAPNNYGYRLILPMYLFMPIIGAGFATHLVTRATA